MIRDILEMLKDAILFFPRKLHNHLEYVKELEEENEKLEKKIHERDLAFKRIVTVCGDNNYGDSNGTYKLHKIKELAQPYPND